MIKTRNSLCLHREKIENRYRHVPPHKYVSQPMMTILLSFLLFAFYVSPVAAESISGRVTGPNNEPLGDWCVHLYKLNTGTGEWESHELFASCTGSVGLEDEGLYTISSVAPGTYRLGFFERNYVDFGLRDEFYDDAFTLEDATNVVVNRGDDLTGIDVQLEWKAGITGEVRDGLGRPLKNISVGLYKRGADSANGSQNWHLVSSTTTSFMSGATDYYLGSEGGYVFFDLPLDTYRVGFTDGNTLYKTQYYSNTHYIQDAQDITVERGVLHENIDAQLEGITINTPPLAVSDTITVGLGGTTTLPPSVTNVLDNDVDLENDSLTAILVDQPEYGTVTLSADGAASYLYNEGQFGQVWASTVDHLHGVERVVSDSFSYKASDGQAESAVTTVLIRFIDASAEAPTTEQNPITDTEESPTSSTLLPFIAIPDIAPLFDSTRQSFDGYCDTVSEIPVAECNFLVQLYETNPNGSFVFWDAAERPCNWSGITCSDGHVIELKLPRNGLTNIPVEVENLGVLTYLDVGGNQLQTVPLTLWSLTTLTTLYLSGNQLTSIPAEIGNLTSLTTLGLSYNQLTALPPEIGNLALLETFKLHHNALTSLPAAMGNLSALAELTLSNNALTGVPAELGNLSAEIVQMLKDLGLLNEAEVE